MGKRGAKNMNIFERWSIEQRFEINDYRKTKELKE
jgi:hypothetical protein